MLISWIRNGSERCLRALSGCYDLKLLAKQIDSKVEAREEVQTSRKHVGPWIDS